MFSLLTLCGGFGNSIEYLIKKNIGFTCHAREYLILVWRGQYFWRKMSFIIDLIGGSSSHIFILYNVLVFSKTYSHDY